MPNTLFVMEKMCISGKNSAFKALERCVVVFLVIMFLCSCSAEHKAKRFIKNLDNKYEYLFRDINNKSAYVYYREDNKYYKYNVRTKKTSDIFELNDSDKIYIYDNCDSGKGDVFYFDINKKDIFRRNLISDEEASIISYDEDKRYSYVGFWNHNLLFYVDSEDLSCDERFINYDADELTSSFIKFDDIESEYKKHFIPTAIIGPKGIMIVLQPYNIEDGMDLSKCLYYYDVYKGENGELVFLCQTDNVKLVGEDQDRVIIAEKDIYSMVMYDLEGKIKKEFPTILRWPRQRGLSAGNMVAQSDEYNILCYIANDDAAIISSVDLYYYDGNNGEEVKIDKYTNADGESVSFTMGEPARRNIKARSYKDGLVFYGGTDFLNEMALFYFDFASRRVSIIDRGSYITYEKGLFKVEHHNGSEAWYNSNGEASSPRSSLYDMGVEWGNIINSLF